MSPIIQSQKTNLMNPQNPDPPRSLPPSPATGSEGSRGHASGVAHSSDSTPFAYPTKVGSGSEADCAHNKVRLSCCFILRVSHTESMLRPATRLLTLHSLVRLSRAASRLARSCPEAWRGYPRRTCRWSRTGSLLLCVVGPRLIL